MSFRKKKWEVPWSIETTWWTMEYERCTIFHRGCWVRLPKASYPYTAYIHVLTCYVEASPEMSNSEYYGHFQLSITIFPLSVKISLCQGQRIPEDLPSGNQYTINVWGWASNWEKDLQNSFPYLFFPLEQHEFMTLRSLRNGSWWFSRVKNKKCKISSWSIL